MNESHDETDFLDASCPQCGSRRLHWSLRRERSRNTSALRYFAWSCNECDAVWTEPIVFGMRPIVDGAHEERAD